MVKLFIFCRIQLKFCSQLYKKRWHTSWKFQLEIRRNKKGIAKKPLTNLYEITVSLLHLLLDAFWKKLPSEKQLMFPCAVVTRQLLTKINECLQENIKCLPIITDVFRSSPIWHKPYLTALELFYLNTSDVMKTYVMDIC